MTNIDLRHGDCLDILAELPDNSVDAVVTDPPYGLANTDPAHVAETITRWVNGERDYLPGGAGFMGKAWDAFVPPVAVWDDCLRVLKPGGHVLAFAGSRTVDLMTLGLRLAGFDIRDSIAWLYGSGFPKSLDVSKAIDKAAGADREVVGRATGRRAYGDKPTAHAPGGMFRWGDEHFTWDDLPEHARIYFAEAAERRVDITAPATDAARTWQGWGTALKPAWESVVVARKSLPLLDRIGSRLDALEDECRRLANSAAPSSAPTRHDSPAATTGSAPASAATPREGEPERTTRTGAAAGSSATTGTSWSEWQATTCSNIVTSWKRSLVVLSQPTSTSTTATTSGTTTDLTTLWSSLSQITEPSTLLSETSPDGLSSLARIVDDLFGAALLNWRATQTLTATEPATSGTPHDSQAAGGRPQLEPVVVARKPLAGTVAANVLAWGTGALNIDGCRVEGDVPSVPMPAIPKGDHTATHALGNITGRSGEMSQPHPAGRWPANVILDESQAAALDEQSGEAAPKPERVGRMGGGNDNGTLHHGNPDTIGTWPADAGGGASRFFYVAKADASERVRVNGTAHPTVKPLALMRWLVRLVTPPGGTVLEPFAGSGTTVEACILEGFSCIAIEREADYLPLIRQRINRRRDPVEAVKATGEDGGLFDLLDGGAA